MGSYNGAEVYNMVELFMLSEIKTIIIFNEEQFGIYRDDGLSSNLNWWEPQKAQQTNFSINVVLK